VTGGREALAYAIGTFQESLLLGLPLTVVLVRLVSGLRSRRLAAVALFLVLSGLNAFQVTENPGLMSGAILGSVILVVVLTRFGLLAFVAMYFPLLLLGGVAIRFDAAPYVTASYVVLGVVGALALYGLHTALGGRPLLGGDPGTEGAAARGR
jgi:hypothetical protein